jgi:hypothetical protein
MEGSTPRAAAAAPTVLSFPVMPGRNLDAPVRLIPAARRDGWVEQTHITGRHWQAAALLHTRLVTRGKKISKLTSQDIYPYRHLRTSTRWMARGGAWGKSLNGTTGLGRTGAIAAPRRTQCKALVPPYHVECRIGADPPSQSAKTTPRIGESTRDWGNGRHGTT